MNDIFHETLSFRPRINRDITVEVQSTESLRYLSYQVLGRGDIILSNSVEIPNRKSHIINFLASFAMVPKAQFVVHYIRDYEIISDRLEIDLGEDLQNFVSDLKDELMSLQYFNQEKNYLAKYYFD